MKDRARGRMEPASGESVEVPDYFGELYRPGVIEHVMPDSSGVWLAADGVYTREFIDQADACSIGTIRSQRGTTAVP